MDPRDLVKVFESGRLAFHRDGLLAHEDNLDLLTRLDVQIANLSRQLLSEERNLTITIMNGETVRRVGRSVLIDLLGHPR